MTSYIDIVIFVVVLVVIAYSFYQDRNNELWSALASAYLMSENVGFDRATADSDIEMVFFWSKDKQEDYDYFNSMKVSVADSGIAFLPTINHLAIKPVFIPWNELEIVGSRKLWMKERLVLSARQSYVNVTILEKWRSRVQRRITKLNHVVS